MNECVIHENFHTKHSRLTAPDEHMPYIIQLHIMSIRWAYYEQMKQQNIWSVHMFRERDRETDTQTDTDTQTETGRQTGGQNIVYHNLGRWRDGKVFPNDQSTTKVIIILGRHLSRGLGKMLQEPKRPNLERLIGEANVHSQHRHFHFFVRCTLPPGVYLSVHVCTCVWERHWGEGGGN